jgi:hypothetical protein
VIPLPVLIMSKLTVKITMLALMTGAMLILVVLMRYSLAMIILNALKIAVTKRMVVNTRILTMMITMNVPLISVILH